MSAHLYIFVAFINLLIGVWAIVHLRYLGKSHRFPYLKHLAQYTFFLNLAVFQLLVFMYGRANLPGAASARDSQFLGESWNFASILLISAMLFSLAQVSRELLGLRLLKRAFLWYGAWCGLVLLIFLGKNFLASGFFQRLAAFTVNQVLDSLLLLEPAILICLLVASRKNAEPTSRKMIAGFCWLYLSRYGGWLLLFCLSGIARPIWLLLAAAVFLYANIVPFLWSGIYFTGHLGSRLEAMDVREQMAALEKQFNLTKRELEILALMLEGRNNKEINTLLFISYHTVKNHVTSIYRKLGVRNRYQLIHRVAKQNR